MSYFENRRDDEFVTVADLRFMFQRLRDEVDIQNNANDEIVKGLKLIKKLFLKINDALNKDEDTVKYVWVLHEVDILKRETYTRGEVFTKEEADAWVGDNPYRSHHRHIRLKSPDGEQTSCRD